MNSETMKIKVFKPVSKLHFSYIKFKFNDNVSFNDVFFRLIHLIVSDRLILENDI